jgi:signal transduction histidine kinase
VSAPGAVEHRLTAGMRLLLAATALVVTSIAPPESSRALTATYVVLAVYLAHAAAICLTARLRNTSTALQYSLPWLDLVACAVLLGLNGWQSVYFVLFFFGIAVLSLCRGFASGAAATIASSVLFVAVGYLSHRAGTVFALDQFLLRLIALAVLGYMMAFRGEYELRLRRRLGLLRDIGTLSNPRFGPNRMLARALESLRAFHDADFCVAILATHDSRGHELRRATRARADAAFEPEKISGTLAEVLLSFGDELVCFRPGVRGSGVVARSVGNGTGITSDPSRYQEVAELLGARAYLSVPLRADTRTLGRLYVAADDPAFDGTDREFLLQAADRIMPVLTHIELIERMATRAEEDERHRIALDIHDRLIQPYIGLQMGINAVCQLVSRYPEPALPPVIRERTATLAALSEVGIQNLRGYVRELRGAPAACGMLEALRRFSRRFHEATGIHVTLDVDGELAVSDRLAAEIFSMACEAISNVRRHTCAPSATIALRTAGQRVVLRVENPAEPGAPREPFAPRSITERAAAINGNVSVELTREGRTAVVVEVPL